MRLKARQPVNNVVICLGSLVRYSVPIHRLLLHVLPIERISPAWMIADFIHRSGVV